MPLVDIHGGARIEVPNLAEIELALGGALGPEARQAWWQEQQDIARERELYHARSIKRVEVTNPITPNASTFFQAGPEEGFVWGLRIASATLGAAGNFAVYKASAKSDTRRLLGQGASISVNSVNQANVTWGSGLVTLKHGEGVYLTADQSMLGIYLAAWQVPAEMEWKLL